MKKKKAGRPKTGETKTRALFSVDTGVLLEFRRHCKRNKENMSGLIQKWMHEYNIQSAEI